VRCLVFSVAIFALVFGFLSARCPAQSCSGGGNDQVQQEGSAALYERYDYPYFVKNTVTPPKGETALVRLIESKEAFDEMFGVGMLMGTRPRLIEDDHFKEHVVVAFAEWGETPWEYTVRGVGKADRQLVVKVSKKGVPSTTAAFSPFLILVLGRETLDGVDKVLFDFIPEESPVTATGEVFSVSR
jgi:hypothetical protein